MTNKLTKYFTIILFLGLTLNSFLIKAQSLTQTVNTDSTSLVIPVTSIIEEIRETTSDLKLIKKKAEPASILLEIDSLFANYKIYIEDQQAKAYEFIKANPNRQKLDNLIKKWNTNKNKLLDWESSLNSHVTKNAELIKSLDQELKTWEATYDNAKALEAPNALLVNVNQISQDIESQSSDMFNDASKYLRLESKVDKLLLTSETVINNLQDFKSSKVYQVFYKRHVPMWDLSQLKATKHSIKKEDVKTVKNNVNSLFQFVKSSPEIIIIFALIAAFIIISIRYFRSSFIKYELVEKENHLQHYKDILIKQYRATIIFLCLILIKIYIKNGEELFTDLAVLGLLFAALPIVMPYEKKPFKNIFYFIVLFFVLDTAKTYAWFSSPQYRIFLLVESFLVIVALYHFTKSYKFKPSNATGTFAKFLTRLAPIIYFLLLISIISNIFGYTNLTDLTLIISIQSIVISVVFYALLLIAESLFISVIHRHYSVNTQFTEAERANVEKKVLSAVRGIIFILWVVFLLNVIDQLRTINEFFELALSEDYKIGNITFTLGAILLFFTILAITFITTNIISFLINDGKGALRYFKLPKGVPSAISLVLRYLILGFGFIFSLSVLGIDLSSFNLMAGALGIGIGFGLQTVISNFVSGLILVFERPILQGDIVEVNNLFGTVNKIGVRSSVISTYDGAEVIVPNNNLISNDLINWTLSSNFKRIEILIGTAYGTNPNTVLQILLDAANECQYTLKNQEPVALFNDFGDSSLNFRLRFWVYFENGLQAKSDVSIAIYNKFTDAGIEIPFPQHDIHIKTKTIPGINESNPQRDKNDTSS